MVVFSGNLRVPQKNATPPQEIAGLIKGLLRLWGGGALDSHDFCEGGFVVNLPIFVLWGWGRIVVYEPGIFLVVKIIEKNKPIL